MKKPWVLVVENEQIVALDLEVCLESFGFGVLIATTAEQAITIAERLESDAILMDIQLDGPMDGIEAAEHIRKQADTPLIFLTAYTDSLTIERAAQVNPSGYIVKPINERELYAGIQLALHRRRNQECFSAQYRLDVARSSPVVHVGDMRVDFVRHLVFLKETELRLTKKEFGILRCLTERMGEPVSPEAILSAVWGPQFLHYLQSFRVHIGNLRKKVEQDASRVRIERVHGVGYRLIESPLAPGSATHEESAVV